MTREYIQITGKDNNGLVTNDYGYSLLHIAWLTNGSLYQVLFAYIELFPSELLKPAALLPQELILNNGTGDKINYSQISLSYDEAISWYEKCQKGSIEIPLADTTIEIRDLDFKQVIEWPELLTTNNLYFLGTNWGTVRSHHLAPNRQQFNVDKITDDLKVIRWLSDCFSFEFLNYPHLLGSIYFIAPDPVFRSISCTLGVGDNEYIDFEFVTRRKQRIEGFQLILNELQGDDLKKQHIVPISKNYLRIFCSDKVDRVSYQLRCEKRGILLDSPPTGFIRNISLNMGTNKDNETEKLKALANRGDQRWFYGDDREVDKFFKEEIAKAKTRICLIEPKVVLSSVANLALAITRSEVSFSLVFSEEAFRKDNGLLNTSKLTKQVRDITDKYKKKINILVMKPNESIFYDRLFIVDDTVWLFGNQLNSMSNSLIVRIPYPQSIVRELDRNLNDNKFETLDNWNKEVRD
ncbi:hypothetical protein ABF162_08420 [Vibrio coralliilyticus]|uniref:hypothetical protein n=1 Tax=Vibrio coralliilyticus TaxID=190893 RepID=UPI0005129176|nr:hypothetical protein [Vibrio coralliilyticus]AIU67022.1 hypothetical protein JV59_32405 [Vibrio coralliilyticus]